MHTGSAPGKHRGCIGSRRLDYASEIGRVDGPMGFLRCVETHVDALGEHPDALVRIVDGQVDALLVRGVFERAEMERVVSRLEAGAHGFPRVRMGQQFEAFSLGTGLDLSSEDLFAYFGGVASATRACADLFSDARDLEGRLTDVLTKLGDGRPVEVPCFGDGRPYLGVALHCLPVGGRIPPHCENEQATRKPYRHLRQLLDGVTLMSYYVTLAAAELEGELVVYELAWQEVDHTHFYRGRTRVEDLLRNRPFVRLEPGAGDLLIFDGGRHFHEVAPVAGTKTRWTAGGFLGFSRDGSRIYRWA